MNIGGNVLKAIFGIAVSSDVSQLHDTLDNLQAQNSDIVHSLTNQLTLVKRLSLTAELNTDIISNLSSVVKDHIIRSHDKIHQIVKDLTWFNIIIHAQNEPFTAIQDLEFALLRLIQQLELITAVQFASQGHLPINFVNPTVLLGILKNVSLQLPSSHTLIAGIRN
jgi:hypothetical protein